MVLSSAEGRCISMKKETYTLLIADDEPVTLGGLSSSIDWASIGVRIVAAESSGEDAIRSLLRYKPDIALLDICMPQGDGFSVIAAGQEQHLRTRFIILSGYDEFQYAQQAVNCGAAAYLLKPIDRQVLLDTVRKQCERLEQQMCSSTSDPGQEKSQNLTQLIHDTATGKLTDESALRSQFAAITPAFPFEHLCVLIVKCPPSEHAQIADCLEDALSLVPHVAFMEDASFICTAVHIMPGERANLRLQNLLRTAIAPLRRQGVPVCAALGCHVDNVMQLPLSLQSARKTIQYGFYNLESGVYDSSLLSAAGQQICVSEKWNVSCLAEAITINDLAEMRAQVDDFFAYLRYVPMPPPSYVLGMTFNMVMDLCHYFNSNFGKTLDLPIDRILQELNTQSSLTALRQYLDSILTQLSSRISRDSIYKYSSVLDEVKLYIQQNLNSKILLSDVANHVHLSESYLTALFKRYTGQSFRNYLQQLKMEKAKELISVHHMSIAEVAEMLGYEDYRAFTRAFKRQTDTLPSHLYRHPKHTDMEEGSE